MVVGGEGLEARNPMAVLQKEQPCFNHQDARIQEFCHLVLTHQNQPTNSRLSEEGTEAVCPQGARLSPKAELLRQLCRATKPGTGGTAVGVSLLYVYPCVLTHGVEVDAQKLMSE